MSYIRKEVDLCMIDLAFLFLLELLHLPAMLIVTSLLEIPHSIQGAAYDQQNIYAISPDSKIKRRKYTNDQRYFIFVPYSVTVRSFHTEGIIAIPQVGIGYHRTLSNGQPFIIKAIQLIHDLIHSRSLEIQSSDTK